MHDASCGRSDDSEINPLINDFNPIVIY
jgi:hypothetical protein